MIKYGMLITSYDGTYEPAYMNASTIYVGTINIYQNIAGLSGTVTVSTSYPEVRAETHSVFAVSRSGADKFVPNIYLKNTDSTTCKAIITPNTTEANGAARYIAIIIVRIK